MPEVTVPFTRTAWCAIYNSIRRPRRPAQDSSGKLAELQEVEARAASQRTDICDHLPTLFAEALATQPKLIVELGVRGGESTFALERAAKLAGAHLLGVDLDDCAAVSTYAKRSFVRGDDVVFAQQFPAWCASAGVVPVIDTLFIDTSHFYDHTREELRVWVPFLAPRGKLLLHDTNLRAFYRRNDGSLGAGWDNERGVIRALEEMVGAPLDERHDFTTVAGGWLIRHWAHCNGLTVLQRY